MRYWHILFQVAQGQWPLDNVGEIASEGVNLNDKFDFSNSNYDHSAQWLHAYYERFKYWETVCLTFFGPQSEEGDSTCIVR